MSWLRGVSKRYPNQLQVPPQAHVEEKRIPVNEKQVAKPENSFKTSYLQKSLAMIEQLEQKDMPTLHDSNSAKLTHGLSGARTQ